MKRQYSTGANAQCGVAMLSAGRRDTLPISLCPSLLCPTGSVVSRQVPFLCAIDPRQRKAAAAVDLIRATTEELIAKCKRMVEEEGERAEGDEYVNDADPSILRFLLASRDEVRGEGGMGGGCKWGTWRQSTCEPCEWRGLATWCE